MAEAKPLPVRPESHLPGKLLVPAAHALLVCLRTPPGQEQVVSGSALAQQPLPLFQEIEVTSLVYNGCTRTWPCTVDARGRCPQPRRAAPGRCMTQPRTGHAPTAGRARGAAAPVEPRETRPQPGSVTRGAGAAPQPCVGAWWDAPRRPIQHCCWGHAAALENTKHANQCIHDEGLTSLSLLCRADRSSFSSSSLIAGYLGRG